MRMIFWAMMLHSSKISWREVRWFDKSIFTFSRNIQLSWANQIKCGLPNKRQWNIGFQMNFNKIPKFPTSGFFRGARSPTLGLTKTSLRRRAARCCCGGDRWSTMVSSVREESCGRERTSAASSGGEATSWLSRLQPASQQPPSCLTTIAREIFSQRIKKEEIFVRSLATAETEHTTV